MADKIIDYRVMTLPEYDEMKRQRARSHSRELPPEPPLGIPHSSKCTGEGNVKGKPEQYNGINSLTASAVEGEKLAVKVIPKMTYNGTDYALIFTIPKTISVRGAVITDKQHLVIVLTNGERIDTGVIKLPVSRLENNALTQKADGLYVEKYDDSELRSVVEQNRQEATNAVTDLKNKTVANFNSLAQEVRNNINELSVTVSDNKVDIEHKLEVAVESIDATISGLRTGLENKIDNTKSELQLSISTNRSEVDSRIDSVETHISENEAARDVQRENDLNALNSKIDTNTEAISSLNEKLDTSISEVNSNINSAVARIVNDAPEAYDTLKEVSDWIGSHVESAAEMNSRILSNKSEIDNLKISINSVSNRVDQAEDDINTLNTNVTENANSINNLNDELDQAKTSFNESLNALDSRVTQNEDDIAELKISVDNNAESINGISDRVTQNEENISTINNTLEEHNSLLQTKVDAEYVKNAIEHELLVEDFDINFQNLSDYFSETEEESDNNEE